MTDERRPTESDTQRWPTPPSPPPADSAPTQIWTTPPSPPPPPSPSPHPFGQVQAPPAERRSRAAVGWALVALAIVLVIAAGAGIVFLGRSPAPSPTVVAQSPTPAATTPTTSTVPPTTPAATATAPPSPSLGSPTATGTAGGSPSPSASTSPTPAIGRTAPPDIAAAIDEVMRDVALVRELEPLGDVPNVLLTRDEATAELRRALEEEVDLREVEIEERLVQRLGLLPDDSDLYTLFEELYTASVAAFYRPETDTFYIIERDEPFGPVDRMYVAHEYTHALQDQHYDLEGTRITDNAQGDAQLAQLAAVEGDASLVMYAWAFARLAPDELEELFDEANSPDPELMERMPPILRRQLAFPYVEGFQFSSHVYALAGWDGINRSLSEPPASTEQILHPQLYLDGHAPILIEATDWLEELGPDWQVAYEQTMGELNMQIWLADGEEPPPLGFPGEEEPWQTAAAGWGGDRLRMYENAAGDWAIVWETAWDSDADAAEFAAMAEPLLEQVDGPATLVSAGTEVRITIASDDATLAALSGGD